MKTNGAVFEGARTVNYPAKRKPAKKSDFPWKRDKYGRLCLVLLGLKAEEMAGPSLEVQRDFYKQGVRGPALLHFLEKLCPAFPAYYVSLTGVELSASIVWNRVHKMFYNNKLPKGRRCVRSDEHFKAHPALRPLIPLATEYYRQGIPLTVRRVRLDLERIGIK